MNKQRMFGLAILFALAMALPATAPAQVFTNLHNFGGYRDGRNPIAQLTAVWSMLYGTTEYGGRYDYGTIFSINADGSNYSVLYNIWQAGPDYGNYPTGPVTVGGDMFYGMTPDGGDPRYIGNIYSINTNGNSRTFSELYDFTGNSYTNTDGCYPYGGLTLVGSTLYGTTPQCGEYGDGTIFSINTDGTGYNILHQFGSFQNDGHGPAQYSSLLKVGNKLYGTTTYAGLNGYGTVFSINLDGTGYTTLYSFGSVVNDGAYPQAGLTVVGSKLYGTTAGNYSVDSVGSGDPYDYGTVFAINLDGTGYTNLYAFGTFQNDGISPNSTLAVIGSTLYGTTRNGGSTGDGTIFSIKTDGTGYSLLFQFNYYANAQNPSAGVTPVGSTLFGTAPYGADNSGILYALTTSGAARTKVVTLGGNLSFGNVTDGKKATAILTISNNGNSALNVSGISYPYGFSGNWTGTIPPGGTKNVTVTFAPGARGPVGVDTILRAGGSYGGTVTVNSDANNAPNMIGISGTGVPIHTKIISVTGNLDFGNVTTGKTVRAMLTISNTGNTALNVCEISYPYGFSGSWTGMIPAGGSHNVTVTFNPSETGGYGGTCTVYSDATDSSHRSIDISGNGVPAHTKIISLSDTLHFGDVVTGRTATATLTIYNNGNTALNVCGLNFSNPVFSGNWSGTIPAGGSHNVTVTFAPGTNWYFNVSCSVGSDATSGTNSVTATGRGVALPPSIGLSNLDFGNVTTGKTAKAMLTISNTGNTALTVSGIDYPTGFSDSASYPIMVPANGSKMVTVTFAPVLAQEYSGTITVYSTGGNPTGSALGTGIPMGQKLLVLNGSLGFDSVVVGQTATASLILTNPGNATVKVTKLVCPTGFSGSWAGQIPGGGSTTVQVTFAPTAATDYSGSVWVYSDALNGNAQTITASGSGLAPDRIIGLAGWLNFGGVTPGSSATATLTISNNGNSDLHVSAINYPNGFTGDWAGGTIPVGQSQNVTVTLAPASLDTYSGNVEVDSDANNSPAATIPVTGFGTFGSF